MMVRNRFIALTVMAIATLWLLGACGNKAGQFVIEGNITDAEGSMLYMEEVGTGNVISLDSVELDREGAFCFRHDGTYYPMFYRLRLNAEAIPFAADSSTHLVLKASGRNFFTGYELLESDADNRKIRDIARKRYHTDCRIDSLITLYGSGMISADSLTSSIDDLANRFRTEMIRHYIYVEPKSAASYFALFQKKGNVMYFDQEDKNDMRAFAAVATAYDTYYSMAPYAPFLKDIALKSIAATRQREALKRHLSRLDSIAPVAFPEIKLKDAKGKEISLTETAALHRRVLLCFTAYIGEWSPQLVRLLRDMYDRREQYDLQIFEVSEDGDPYYWRNASRTLPWICVFDETQTYVKSYNLARLPAFFLIKDGELHALNSPQEALL